MSSRGWNPTGVSAAIVAMVLGIAFQALAQATFTEVAASAGVNATGWGFNSTFQDYDGDGDLDLFLGTQYVNYVFRNNGGGSFTNVIGSTGITGSERHDFAMGDYDNDGDLDIFNYNGLSTPVLWQNNGSGTFTDVTPASGVTNTGTIVTHAGFVDVDGDGYLDLLMGRVTPHVPASQAGQRFLFHNNGNGTFSDATSSSGLASTNLSGAFSFADYDADGDKDLALIATDATYSPPYRIWIYRNRGNGTFDEVTSSAGVVESGSYRSADVNWDDYDNDGDFDLFISPDTGVARLYFNNGNGTFTDVSASSGLSRSFVNSTGSLSADLDNDMDIDILMLEMSGNEFFYWNNGSGTFTEGNAGFDTGTRGALSWGDYDGDGDIDIYVGPYSESGALYQNIGNGNRWLQARLQAAAGNRTGIGARIRVVTAGKAQIQEVGKANGQKGHAPLIVHFGMGGAVSADSLIIRWPSGIVQVQTNVATNQILTVTEPASQNPARITEISRWWPGDGDAQEIIWGNYGELHGGVSFVQGIVNQAFSFDGIDDFVAFPGIDFGDIPTLEMWIKTSFAPQAIIDGGPTFVTWRIGINSEGKVVYQHNLNGTLGFAGITSNTPVTDGRFHHLVAQTDQSWGSRTIKLYVDGALEGSYTDTAPSSDFNNWAFAHIGDVKLGKSDTQGLPGPLFFRGIVDELTLYRRVLSPLEIQSIFNAGSAGKFWGSPPVAEAGPDIATTSTNPSGTEVQLDGTRSYDPDGDPLRFFWSVRNRVSWQDSAAARTKVSLPVGTHRVYLTVFDGMRYAKDSLTVTIEAPSEILLRDDFSDGDWTTNPTWSPVVWRSSMGGVSLGVMDYAELDKALVLGAGWSTEAHALVGDTTWQNVAIEADVVPYSNSYRGLYVAGLTLRADKADPYIDRGVSFSITDHKEGGKDYASITPFWEGHDLGPSASKTISLAADTSIERGKIYHLRFEVVDTTYIGRVYDRKSGSLLFELRHNFNHPVFARGRAGLGWQGGSQSGIYDNIVIYRISASSNHPPIAMPDTATIPEGYRISIAVLKNDSDPDGDPLSLVQITQPYHGTAVIARDSVSYVPQQQFTGVDSLFYTISDGKGESATSTVRVRVINPNNPPVAEAGADTTVECAQCDGTLVQLDGSRSFDPDGEPINFAWYAPGIRFDDSTRVMSTAKFPLGPTKVYLNVYNWVTGMLASGRDSVMVSVRDTRSPRVKILSPLQNAAFGAADTINVVFAASDTCDTTLYTEVTPAPRILPPLNLGPLTIRVRARDGSGNLGADSVTVQVVRRPIIAVFERLLRFGKVDTGMVEARSLAVSNRGDTVLDVRSIAAIGPDSAAFKVTPTSTSISPGQSRDLRVEFRPQMAGWARGRLKLYHSAPGNSLEVALSGIGRVKPPRDTLERTKIAYVIDGSPEKLAVMTFAGTKTDTLVTNHGHIFEPAWFPDVEAEVVVTYGLTNMFSRNYDLFSINAEERTPPVNLTSTAVADEFGPAWSPDGKKLAFWSNRNGVEGIYVSENPADSNAPRLIYATNDTSGASWSPDGRKLAFASRSGSNWEIFVKDVEGGRLDTLTRHPSNDRFPAWSPDGTQIAFVSERDGNAEVYLVDVDGDSLVNLTQDATYYDAFPSWAPDGTHLAFSSQSYTSDSGYICLLELKTKALSKPVQNGGRPAWSPFLPIPVAFDFDPNTVQKGNENGRVTGYVQLPPEYGVCGDINSGTVRLNGTIAPILDEKYGFAKTAACGDQNKDGISEQMFKFERAAVVEKLEPPQGRLRISGRLKNGKIFAGRDSVQVILPGKGQVKGKAAKLAAVPEVYFLSPCRPNPFNPTTHIDYGLPEAQKVRLTVYNVLGQRIAVLADSWQDAGFYNVVWEARDLPTGLYFYQLQAGEFTQMRRMMLVK